MVTPFIFWTTVLVFFLIRYFNSGRKFIHGLNKLFTSLFLILVLMVCRSKLNFANYFLQHIHKLTSVLSFALPTVFQTSFLSKTGFLIVWDHMLCIHKSVNVVVHSMSVKPPPTHSHTYFRPCGSFTFDWKDTHKYKANHPFLLQILKYLHPVV